MRILKPEVFQGSKKRKNYFEGWYYKIITADKKHAIAFIAGISYPKAGKDNHAFVQFFDDRTGKTGYYRYVDSDFRASKEEVDIKLGKNHFCKTGFSVDLSKEELAIRGKLKFGNIISYPTGLWEPGIMGPFAMTEAT